MQKQSEVRRQLAGTKHGTSCSRRVYRVTNDAATSPAEQTEIAKSFRPFFLFSLLIFLFSSFQIPPSFGIHKFHHFLVITRYKRHRLLPTIRLALPLTAKLKADGCSLFQEAAH